MTGTIGLKKGGSAVVYIQTESIDESISNKLIKVARPLSYSSQDTTIPYTKVRDLKRFDHTFNIIGYLSVDANSGNTTWPDAEACKNYLVRVIFYNAGDILMTYRNLNDARYGTPYGGTTADITYVHVNLDSAKFTEDSKHVDVISGTSSYISRYKVNLSLTRGIKY